MAEPGWLKTISSHAVIKKVELLEWLGVTSTELRIMLRDDGFPPPRFGGFRSKQGERITNTSRWRVGDVRAWLEGSPKLKNELATEVGSEASASVKAARAGGIDWVSRVKRT